MNRKQLENLAWRYSEVKHGFAASKTVVEKDPNPNYDPSQRRDREHRRTNKLVVTSVAAFEVPRQCRKAHAQFQNSEQVFFAAPAKNHANRRLNGSALADLTSDDLIDLLPSFLQAGAKRASNKGTRKQRRANLQSVEA